ncbi:hypothetical protein SISNIDRAFT_414258 [Sistotremastrum niveocremeum HHB9708]|uniref:Uncharacterized protein n=1 Tax=Sistotremastrum niveocremeum HHB9708 TaxID=1314777 RepID=A0A164SD96_9AGAM|nr:hypothetical protein SISNIDRAFT_414258 [Sistotremastrum niveocremeum HHB9708]
METWFPVLFAHYMELSKDCCLRYPNLHVIAPGCPFMAMLVNVGPLAVCETHIDSRNLVAGLCAILVLGAFDHTLGGHLILMEAKVICEGLVGCIFLIPSAACLKKLDLLIVFLSALEY